MKARLIKRSVKDRANSKKPRQKPSTRDLTEMVKNWLNERRPQAESPKEAFEALFNRPTSRQTS
jgi:hypothetical protein